MFAIVNTVPPRWAVEPQNAFVVLGGSVVINCSAVGDPQPVVVWKKDTGR